MGKTVTYTVKIDSKIRDLVSKHCASKGIKIKNFIENAFIHEIRLEKAKDRIFDFDCAFKDMDKRKKLTGADFVKLMKEPKPIKNPRLK